MIKYHCPKCNQKLGVPDNYAGRRVRCNKCSEPSIVPKPLTEIDITAALPVAAAKPASPELSPEQVAASIFQAPAAVKPAPVQIELQRPMPKPQQLDELQLIPEDDDQAQEDLRKAEILREASRQRAASSMAAAPKAPKEASSRRAISGGELAKGMGKIPLSIATCIGCMAAVIVLGVIVGKLTGFRIGYIAIGIPLAGAWGLTLFTENRGILLGLLAVILGFFGLIAGHVADAKWIIMPMIAESGEFQSELDQAFQQRIILPETLPTEPAELEGLAQNETLMLRVAAWDLVQAGQLDQQLFTQMCFVDINDEDEDISEPLQEAFYDAADHLDVMSTAQRVALIRKYHPDMATYYAENIQPLLNKVANVASFGVAFLCSFGFLDLLWFPMGLFGAYKLGAGVDD